MAEFPIQVECAARFFGKLATAMFAGSAVYGSLVHHPAMVDTDDKCAVDAFNAMFKRAARSQISYLFSAAVCNGYVYYFHRDEKSLLYSTAVFLTILPYTKLAMMPTNLAILGVPENVRKAELGDQEEIYKKGKENVKFWGKLHAVRSIIGLAAISILIYKS